MRRIFTLLTLVMLTPHLGLANVALTQLQNEQTELLSVNKTLKDKNKELIAERDKLKKQKKAFGIATAVGAAGTLGTSIMAIKNKGETKTAAGQASAAGRRLEVSIAEAQTVQEDVEDVVVTDKTVKVCRANEGIKDINGMCAANLKIGKSYTCNAKDVCPASSGTSASCWSGSRKIKEGQTFTPLATDVTDCKTVVENIIKGNNATDKDEIVCATAVKAGPSDKLVYPTDLKGKTKDQLNILSFAFDKTKTKGWKGCFIEKCKTGFKPSSDAKSCIKDVVDNTQKVKACYGNIETGKFTAKHFNVGETVFCKQYSKKHQEHFDIDPAVNKKKACYIGVKEVAKEGDSFLTLEEHKKAKDCAALFKTKPSDKEKAKEKVAKACFDILKKKEPWFKSNFRTSRDNFKVEFKKKVMEFCKGLKEEAVDVGRFQCSIMGSDLVYFTIYGKETTIRVDSTCFPWERRLGDWVEMTINVGTAATKTQAQLFGMVFKGANVAVTAQEKIVEIFLQINPITGVTGVDDLVKKFNGWKQDKRNEFIKKLQNFAQTYREYVLPEADAR